MRVTPATLTLESLGLAYPVRYRGQTKMRYSEKGKAIAASLHDWRPQMVVLESESMAYRAWTGHYHTAERGE